MAQDWRPSQESNVYVENNEQLIQVQDGHSENILLAGPNHLSDTTHPRTAEERNDVQDKLLGQDLTNFDFLFEGIDSSQAVEQAIQLWPPFQISGIHFDYNENNERSIQIQGNDITAATSSELQKESPQEDLFVPFLTGSNESHCMYHTLVHVPCASHLCRAEGQNDMAAVHDNPPSHRQDRTGFNANNEEYIQLESRHENYGSFSTGSGELPNTSYTSMQTPIDVATGLWTAEERNNMILKQNGPLSLDWTDSNFLRFPVGKDEYSQPTNGQVLSRLYIPPSGAAGPPTSSTTTVPSAQSSVESSAAWSHLTADDVIRNVGSSRIQQASERRREKEGKYQCPFDNFCNKTFTETHNLEYHVNAHLNLRPYKCTECLYAANSPATLKRHRRRHQNV